MFARKSVTSIIRCLVLLIILLFSLVLKGNGEQTDINKFFRAYAALSDDEIKAIHNGTAVAKVVDSPAEQVLIFGAVYIKAKPESYLAFASNVEETSKIPGYIAIRKFSDPPQLSDLDKLTLDAEDIKDLQNC